MCAPNDTYFTATTLARRAFSSSIFSTHELNVQCKDIENISQFQIFEEHFLDEALTLAYGVDARMGDFADISEADTLTQQPYFLGILLTHCLV